MASNYTEHYQLPLWEQEDSFLREEFNEANRKIDTALGTLKNSLVHIVTGEYTGTGTYGSNNKNQITLEFVPKVIMVRTQHGYLAPVMFFQGESCAHGGYTSGSSATQEVNWSSDGKTVFWYNTENADKQLNYNGGRYLYLALG